MLAPVDWIRFIDLTRLNDTDTPAMIAALCAKAQSPQGNVAAVCVYPKFVAQARQHLPNSLAVATVVNFPGGDQATRDSVAVIKQALQEGADEIDAVLPYSLLQQGETEAVLEFIQTCRRLCQSTLLKIIIESGVLKEDNLITQACELCIEGKADFIKTSTGKRGVGATLGAAKTILQAIKRYPQRRIGLKVSGGLRTVADAQAYVELVKDQLGVSWLQPATFRIGASHLLDQLLKNA